MKKMKLIKTTFLLILIISLFSCYGLPKTTVRGVGNEGQFQITVVPETAEVYVDGNYVGLAKDLDGNPGYLELSSGTHTVEIKMTGYQPYSRDVYSSGSLQTIKVNLVKLQ